jgi:hypothetical protein
MRDGCWIQFWDDKNCAGATLRFDAQSGTLLVSNLDDYYQSDGRKEGNEPDSLKTGTRAWLIVYKDDNYGGKSAMFGPNSEIADLGLYGMGGNISSFKLYDYRPSYFVDSANGNPIAIETNSTVVNASTVNTAFRTCVAAAVALIPGIGSSLSILVRGLWPDVDNSDQTWASFQNYLNQAIAGVYWQLTYESLNNVLESLFKAAENFVNTPDDERELKKAYFFNLLDLANNTESFFIDESAPEKKYSFIVPFATLRLATLREQLEHYEYYYGSPPSPETSEKLTAEIQASVQNYQRLLSESRDRILNHRDQMISVDGDYIIDFYYGRRVYMYYGGSESYYRETILNQLALTVDEHNATGQLWTYFDPAVTGPAQAPVLNYATGPFGQYQQPGPNFEQMAGGGRITGMALWTSEDINGLYTSGLELYIDGIGQGRVGGAGGTEQLLILEAGERIDYFEGSYNNLRYMSFTTNLGNSVSSGDKNKFGVDYQVYPLSDSSDTRLVGVTGYADSGVRGISLHWTCNLLLNTEASGISRRDPIPRLRAEAGA